MSFDLAGGLGRGPPDADAPRHAHPLHVGRPARVHGDDPIALLQLEEAEMRRHTSDEAYKLAAEKLQRIEAEAHGTPRINLMQRPDKPVMSQIT